MPHRRRNRTPRPGRPGALLALAAVLVVGAGCDGSGPSAPPGDPEPARLLLDAFQPPAGGSRIYAVNHDGTGLLELGPGACPRWSGRAGRIVFPRSEGGNAPAELYLMDGDGRNAEPVPGIGDVGCPDWSPDGERIVFLYKDAPDDGEVTGPRLFTVRPDGSDLRDLRVYGDMPAWSPDGEWIAYTNDDGLHVIRPDGSDGRQIVPDVVNQLWITLIPEWTPDSRAILFVAFTGAAEFRLFRVGLNGPGPVPLTSDAGFWDASARLSPDGSRLLMRRQQWNGQGWTARLYIAKPDASDRVEVMLPAIPGQLGNATWGPGS